MVSARARGGAPSGFQLPRRCVASGSCVPRCPPVIPPQAARALTGSLRLLPCETRRVPPSPSRAGRQQKIDHRVLHKLSLENPQFNLKSPPHQRPGVVPVGRFKVTLDRSMGTCTCVTKLKSKMTGACDSISKRLAGKALDSNPLPKLARANLTFPSNPECYLLF